MTTEKPGALLPTSAAQSGCPNSMTMNITKNHDVSGKRKQSQTTQRRNAMKQAISAQERLRVVFASL